MRVRAHQSRFDAEDPLVRLCVARSLGATFVETAWQSSIGLFLGSWTRVAWPSSSVDTQRRVSAPSYLMLTARGRDSHEQAPC